MATSYLVPYQTFRSTAVTNAATAATAGKCTLIGWNIVNLHSAAIFVKFYNLAAASVVVGTTTPTDTIQIGANGTALLRDGSIGEHYGTALSVAAVTEGADSGTTAPATLPIIKLFYD